MCSGGAWWGWEGAAEDIRPELGGMCLLIAREIDLLFI